MPECGSGARAWPMSKPWLGRHVLVRVLLAPRRAAAAVANLRLARQPRVVQRRPRLLHRRLRACEPRKRLRPATAPAEGTQMASTIVGCCAAAWQGQRHVEAGDSEIVHYWKDTGQRHEPRIDTLAGGPTEDGFKNTTETCPSCSDALHGTLVTRDSRSMCHVYQGCCLTAIIPRECNSSVKQ